MGKKLRKYFIFGLHFIFICFVSSVVLSGSSLLATDFPEKVRQYTHTIEFDYVDWTLRAIGSKIEQASVRLEDYLPEQTSANTVRDYVTTVAQISQLNAQISDVYANPDISDKEIAAKPFKEELKKTEQKKDQLAPLVESTLQTQISWALAQNNLTMLGQPIPPVLFHSTPLPMALIVSPRNKIQQDANISLMTEMSAEDMDSLEDQVMQNLNVSALVVPVGGVGVYPTMVMSTSDLPYLVETIAHEWTHNYLTLRPLGLNYETTPDLRTINETVASIAGGEIGQQVLRQYYPELLPKEVSPVPAAKSATVKAELSLPNVQPFDFRKEMHTTRVTADGLLAGGKVKEAESYMEERRTFFWNNGYAIRRLNQAYFAFYGAYADTPGGAAGKDPVGPVVRAFRAQSGSLSSFLDQISRVTSLEQLKGMVKTLPAE
jgi:uncharacterized protein YcbK (DUF882 family)